MDWFMKGREKREKEMLRNIKLFQICVLGFDRY